jgi:hypothetical protein
MKAVEVMKKWTPEIEARCSAILNNGPAEEFDFPRMNMVPNRRKTQLYTKQ